MLRLLKESRHDYGSPGLDIKEEKILDVGSDSLMTSSYNQALYEWRSRTRLLEIKNCSNKAPEIIDIVIPWEHHEQLNGIFVAGADKRGEFKLLFNSLARCFTCYNIIKIDLDEGEIDYFDLDDDYHECCNANTVDESDEFHGPDKSMTFLELINTRHEDLDTGELKRAYYEQAKD